MSVLRLAFIGVFLLGAGLGSDASDSSDRSDAWKEFRGPRRSGVSAETGLARQWPPEGPRELWRSRVGDGFSGVAFAGDRFFTLFATEDREYVGCFRAADGTEIWRREIDDEVFVDEFGRGPRATPTVTAELVYALSGRGNLVAVDAADGAPRWQVDLFRDERYGFFGPQWSLGGEPPGKLQMPNWGYSWSPLVEGDLVLAETGTGKGRSYVAFDRFTGEPRWTALDHPLGYSSPIAATIAGRRQIVAVADTDLVSLSPAGELYWRLPFAPTIGQPIFVPPDQVFVSTVPLVHFEGGAMLVKVAASQGGVAATPVWKSPILKILWGAPVYYDGHLYGFDNATLRCLRAADGEPRWARRGLGKGSLIVADGLLIVYGDNGLLVLADASPEGYAERGRVKAFDAARTWTPPALAGGRLYLRAGDELVALAVGAEP